MQPPRSYKARFESYDRTARMGWIQGDLTLTGTWVFIDHIVGAGAGLVVPGFSSSQFLIGETIRILIYFVDFRLFIIYLKRFYQMTEDLFLQLDYNKIKSS